MQKTNLTESALLKLGEYLGASLGGGEVIELVGDVGAGKTTFVKGLARGLDIKDDIQSPTYTISRIYETPDGLSLAHYDFYRLRDAGILSMEIEEAISSDKAITVVEWGGIVEDVLPDRRITVRLAVGAGDDRRSVRIDASGDHERRLIGGLE